MYLGTDLIQLSLIWLIWKDTTHRVIGKHLEVGGASFCNTDGCILTNRPIEYVHQTWLATASFSNPPVLMTWCRIFQKIQLLKIIKKVRGINPGSNGPDPCIITAGASRMKSQHGDRLHNCWEIRPLERFRETSIEVHGCVYSTTASISWNLLPRVKHTCWLYSC